MPIHRPSRRAAGVLVSLVAVLAPIAATGAGPAAAAELVVLDDGHVDALSPRLDGSSLLLEVEDDTGESPVRRDPADVLFHVVPESETAVPDDPRYTSLLGPAGTPIWMIPEVQQAGIVWAGWSTEELATGALAGNTVDIVLRDVEGPGDLVVFASSAFGDPLVRFNTKDGLPDTRTETVGSHVHANWAFDAEGTYTVTFEVTGSLTGGTPVTTGLVDYTFTVGELSTDPVTSLSIGGMAASYDAGDTVTLNAVQDPVTELDHYHWFTRCEGTAEWTIVPDVGVGTYSFTAAEDLDGCEYQVRLYGDGHAVVAESAPATLHVAAPTETEQLVRELYRVVLDRAPSQGDLDYWAGRIDGGGDPQHLAESLARTREGDAQVVRWAYDIALDRAPEAEGLTYWTDRLQGSRRPDTLVTKLFASPEAWAAGGSTARGWVAYTYEQLLDRAPDAGGHDYWAAELEAGGSSAATRGRVSGVFLRTMEVSRQAVSLASTDACGSATLPTAQRDAMVTVYRASALNPSVLRAAVVIGGCPA